jgi:eukaryotic-like serine/threonine-protein kinase
MPSYQEVAGIEPIGRGGFAEVRMCASSEDGAPFAKKVLTQLDPDSRRRFVREVEILKRIAGSRIMQVIGDDLAADPPFYIMPLYTASLRKLIPTLVHEPQRIPDIFRQILDAVGHAHSFGVIHRDLNPNNILMNGDNDLVVSDFGLGRRLDADTTRATGTNAVMGTSGYMAPEQYSAAEHADERSDIFALGIILNEMYTGTTALGAHLPPSVLVIVRRCTNQHRDLRYPSVAELRRVFDSLMAVQARTDVGQALRKLIDTGMTEESADRLAADVPKASEESRLLHDLVVNMPADTFQRLRQLSPETASLLILKFREVATSEQWDFDYTDKIGNACRRLFSVSDDANIKASLLATALHVGVNYNRYHVQDVAAMLLASNISDTDAVTILSELEPIRHYLVVISHRIPRDKVHHILRSLIDIAEEEYRTENMTQE